MQSAAAGFLLDIAQAQNAELSAAGQMASGLRFTQPSQDPSGAGTAVILDAQNQQQIRWQSATTAAAAWGSATDTALQQALNILQQVRSNTVQGANGSLNANEFSDVANVVSQLQQQFLQIANSQFEGLYLFSGQDVTTQPYASPTAAYAGNSSPISFEIGPSMKVSPSVNGTVFGTAMSAVSQVISDLSSGNVTALGGTDLKNIDQALASLEALQGGLGATESGIQLQQTTLSSQAQSVQTDLASIQNANMAQESVAYSEAAQALQAALTVTSQAMPTSIFKYLQ